MPDSISSTGARSRLRRLELSLQAVEIVARLQVLARGGQELNLGSGESGVLLQSLQLASGPHSGAAALLRRRRRVRRCVVRAMRTSAR